MARHHAVVSRLQKRLNSPGGLVALGVLLVFLAIGFALTRVWTAFAAGVLGGLLYIGMAYAMWRHDR
jgi:hypothetical protein